MSRTRLKKTSSAREMEEVTVSASPPWKKNSMYVVKHGCGNFRRLMRLEGRVSCGREGECHKCVFKEDEDCRC